MNLLEAYSREVLARFIWSRHTGAADILRRQLDGIESICRAEHVAARLQEVQVELEDLRGRRSAATIRRGSSRQIAMIPKVPSTRCKAAQTAVSRSPW